MADLPLLIVAPAGGAQAVEPLRAELSRSGVDVVVHEPRGSSTRAMARAAARAIEQAVRGRREAKAHVCGISLGGMAATWLAVDFARSVERLVLASCVPRMTGRAMVRSLVFGPPLFARVDVEWRRMPELLWAAARHDARSAVERIRAPVLVVAGERDGLFPPAEQRRAWSRLAHARFVTVGGASHAVSLDQPRQLASLIGDFCFSRDDVTAHTRA